MLAVVRGCQGDGPFDNFVKVVKRTVPLTTLAPPANIRLQSPRPYIIIWIKGQKPFLRTIPGTVDTVP